MMKSFFKKLAFVMALAMVVTMAAPAAQKVVAAEDKALAITYQNEKHYTISEVNIASVGDTEDLKFLWAPSNWKELGVKWTSSNENVVTVDNNGVVTAVAAGSADVSVAVGTETATVTVNVEELPAYTVSIGLGDDREVTEKELEIGESVDFAFYGIKDYSRDKVGALPRYLCTWQSDDTTVLTKDDEAGKFTAVAAGTAKVTLTVANVLTGQTHNVIPVAVTVKAPEVVETEQDIVAERNKTQNTIVITLDKAGALDLNTVEIFRVFFADNDENGDGVIDDRDLDKAYEDVYVNKLTPDADKVVWVAETFDDFIDGVTYEVQVAGYKAERFVASVGDVAEVVVLEKDGASLETEDLALDPAHVKVALYDANGVDVTTRKIDGVPNNDPSNITFWLTDETAAEYTMTDYDEVSFYEMATAGVMATYDNNGKEVESTDPCLITPSKANAYGVKRVVMWTLVEPGKVADWTKEVHSVPAGEYDYTIATLLEDERGNYFTTHEKSATANGGNKYGDKVVLWTEDENEAFWIHGYRVEYRAMDPDKMLVEDYGDVASYEEGRARFALYLYNQFETSDKEFIKELYSQYVNVCHPKQLYKATATTSLEILMNTERDEEKDHRITTNVDNAYYSLFSVKKLAANLIDIHGGDARADHAAEANFELTLVNHTDNQALVDLIETYEAELNGQSAAKREITIEANDFKEIGFDKNLVKFTLKETVTNTKITVTVKLVFPELDGDSAKVATIDEYSDILEIPLSFEKFVASTNGFTVQQRITNTVKDTTIPNNHNVVLYQIAKSGRQIGVDNRIFVSNVLSAKNVADVNLDGAATLKSGDRILTVKGPDGKVFALGLDYKNPEYTTKVPAGYEMTATTTALGVSVEYVADYATSASGTAVAVNQFDFAFRTVDADGEIIYAKNGRYTVTIKTVKAVAADGTIEYTKSTGLADSFTITVANDNVDVTYAGRDKTRVEGGINDYDWAGAFDQGKYTVNKEYGDDEDVKKLILAAFNFDLGGKKNWAATADDILYYTYTLTPSNKQVVINDVVFAVPADAADDNKGGYGWYRSTAKVNRSLTFSEEY